MSNIIVNLTPRSRDIHLKVLQIKGNTKIVKSKVQDLLSKIENKKLTQTTLGVKLFCYRSCTYRGTQSQPKRSEDAEEKNGQSGTEKYATPGGEIILLILKPKTSINNMVDSSSEFPHSHKIDLAINESSLLLKLQDLF